MRKAPDAFRTISEAADLLDTPAHVLRFWESKFPQIKPVKRAGGRRYYRRVDIDLLAGIRLLLHDQGMTIRGVQKLLQEKGPRHVAELAPVDALHAEEDAVILDFPTAAIPIAETVPDPAPGSASDSAPADADTGPDATQDAIQDGGQETAPLARAETELPQGPANVFASIQARPPTPPAPPRTAPPAPAPMAKAAPIQPARLAHRLRSAPPVALPAHAADIVARLEALLARMGEQAARDRARR